MNPMKFGSGRHETTAVGISKGKPLAYQTTLFLVFLSVFILAALLVPNFFTLENLMNILRQAAPTMIVAAAMTLVITLAGIDLSVGSGLAVVAVLSAMALTARWPP